MMQSVQPRRGSECSVEGPPVRASINLLMENSARAVCSSVGETGNSRAFAAPETKIAAAATEAKMLKRGVGKFPPRVVV